MLDDESGIVSIGNQLIGFLDESGHSSATKFLALAALVIRDADGVAFNGLWQEALCETQAPYIHMREYAHRVGAFVGWTEDLRASSRLVTPSDGVATSH